MRLRKPSRRTVDSDHGGAGIPYTCATCGRCRRGSACRYDCLCFLVIIIIIIIITIIIIIVVVVVVVVIAP